MAKFTPGEIAIIWNPRPDKTNYVDTSQFHGEECTIESVNPLIGEDGALYDYTVLTGEDDHRWFMLECELKKKYDGDEVTSWEQCEWRPNKDLVT